MKGSSMLIVVIVSNAIMVKAVGHEQMSSCPIALLDRRKCAIAGFSRRSEFSYFPVLNQCLMIWSVGSDTRCHRL